MKDGQAETAAFHLALGGITAQVNTLHIIEIYAALRTILVVLSGQGKCIALNQCKCDKYWKGEACNLPSCPASKHSLAECSGNGQCVGPGTCLCDRDYYGAECETEGMVLSHSDTSCCERSIISV